MPDANWTWIRSTRSNPPALAARDDRRRRQYVAALTQFEQLHEAARRVGAASRPILLFYGLSQAGRALLAAGSSHQWQSHGHGLKLGTPARQIMQTPIRVEGRGLFDAVSAQLSSPVPTHAIELGALWHAIPELPPMDADRWLTALPIRRDVLGNPTDYSVSTAVLVYHDPGVIVDLPYGVKREDAGELLQHYPQAAGARLASGWIMTGLPASARDSVSLEWHDDEDNARRVHLREIGESYGRHGYFLVPALGDSTPSFFAIWWMLLFGMSMLARYEPAIWVRALDVDRSPVAVAVEAGLDRAVDALPEFVATRLQALVSRDALVSALRERGEQASPEETA